MPLVRSSLFTYQVGPVGTSAAAPVIVSHTRLLPAIRWPQPLLGPAGSQTSLKISYGKTNDRVSLSQPGYLLQREARYPGWRARVDGRDAPVLRADALFRAVQLGAGEHDVEIFFDSASFNRGAVVTLTGLLVIILLLAWRPIMRLRAQA